jgi:hypothetical protein
MTVSFDRNRYGTKVFRHFYDASCMASSNSTRDTLAYELPQRNGTAQYAAPERLL